MSTTQVLTNIKKECWEFKGHIFWVPVVMLGFFILSNIYALFTIDSYQIDRLMKGLQALSEAEGVAFVGNASMAAIATIFVPFLITSLFVQLNYLISCMFDEKRDLSIYFWRSLPVSDLQSVAVKLFTGALVIPASFMLAATALIVLAVFLIFVGTVVLSLGFDISLWAAWSEAKIVSSLIVVWLALIPLSLWLFPVYAYLMLASAFAGRAPFLWAVLPVVVIAIVEASIAEATGSNHLFIMEALYHYFSLEVLGEELSLHVTSMHSSLSFSEQLLMVKALFTKVDLIALLIGCGFMYATYWLRVNRRQA
ncbi:hypothetical protein DRW07_14170 [Alteromonas sediminis]|uniref:Uncharacterized protein n=1 Tax=Alteromonas sediminis TaxID=2259342 RepID=A0A3N5XZ20_9ALTE|nr:hypothetical protein [Alteromonas sediminis]RPJ65950.1 hypothetical protein DRW07_14170 [Alteromonas sediminis]